MAALATQTMGVPSGTPTFQAAAAGGDTVTPGDNTRLEVRNGGGAPITVTIPRYVNNSATDADGVAVPAYTKTIAAGAEARIGPLNGSRFMNPATGNVDVAYSAVTSVTVAAIRT